jgi:hypothetical protein
MLRRHPASSACRHADDERDRELAARHIRDRSGVVEDLIERQHAEVDRHDLNDRPHPRHCCANARSHIGALRQGGVANAVFAELFRQAFGDGVAAAVSRDVFAHQKDARIGDQGLTQRLLAGLAVGDRRRSELRRLVHAGISFIVT